MTCYESVLRGNAALDDDNNLTITLPNTVTLHNGDTIRFVITNTVPTTNPLGTASLVVNGTTMSLKTRFGNNVRAEQFMARKLYTVGLGAEGPTMVVLTCLPLSTYSFPSYAPAS